MLDRDFDHGAEITIILATDPYVAGIDTVLGEIASALGILSEQLVTVIVEVADDGHAHTLLVEFLDNVRHCCRRFIVVDRDPHKLGASTSQCGHLLDGRSHIGRVRVGHRLHHNWCIGAHSHSAHHGRNGLSAFDCRHEEYLV